MTTLRPFQKVRQPVALLMIAALAFSQARVHAIDFYLDGRVDGLASPMSYAKWTNELTSADRIVWSSNGGGAITLNGVSNLSTSPTVSVGGILIDKDAPGTLTIQPANPGPSTQTLLLGSAGIDMSDAAANLAINKTNGPSTLALGLSADQLWTVGDARTLTVNANVAGNNHQLKFTTVGSGVITLGGTSALNLGTGPLIIDKQGTGAITFGGAVTTSSINAVNQNSGNIAFSSSTTAPVINVLNQSTGGLTMTGAVNAGTSLTVNSLLSGGVTFGSTVNTPTLNVTVNGSAAETYTGVVTTTNATIAHQSTGALTFSGGLTAASLFDLNVTKAATVAVNGAVTAPTFNLTTQSTGNVTFGAAARINAATVFNLTQLATNTATFNSAVGATSQGIINISTAVGAVTNFTKAVSGTAITVASNSSGALTFGTVAADALTASGALNINATKNSAVTFNGNVSAQTFNLTTLGTGNINFGATTNVTAINAPAGLNIKQYNTNTLTANGTVGATSPGPITLSMSLASVANFTKAVSGSTIAVTNNSTGALTFGTLAADALNASTSLDIVATKNSAITINGRVTAPTFNLTTYGTSAVTFGAPTNLTPINSSAGLNIKQYNANALTVNGTVGATSPGPITLSMNTGASANFTKAVSGSTIDIFDGSTGALTFGTVTADALTASTSLNLAAWRNGAVTVNGNISTPTLNLTTYGTGAVNLGNVTVFNATTVNANTSVTCNSTVGLFPGMAISGTNIPAGATVSSITNATTFVISANATGAGSGLTLIAAGNLSLTGVATTSSSTTVNCTSTTGLQVGMTVNDGGGVLANGTKVTAVTGATSFVISVPATATASGLTLSAFSTLTSSTALNLAAYGSNTTSVNQAIGYLTATAGTVTINPNAGAVYAFSRPVFATTMGLTQNSTGATTFASAATVNANTLNFTGAKSGATTFSGAVSASSLNITSYKNGNLTFGSTTNAGVGVAIQALGANTLTFTGAVTSGAFGTGTVSAGVPAVTAGTLLLSSTLTSPTVNVMSTGTGAATFTGNVAATSFGYRALGNNAATINGLAATSIDIITNSTSATALSLNGAVSGFTTMNVTNNSTGTITLANTAAASITGTGASSLNLINTNGGTFTIGGATGGIIAGASTALNLTSNSSTAGGGTFNLNASNTYGGATTITGGTTSLGYATTNTTKFDNAAALTLNRAILALNGGSHTEVVGSTAIGAGYSQITRPSGTSVLQTGALATSLTRVTGGVLDVFVAGAATTSRVNTNGIIGGWATTVGGTDWAINAGSTNGAMNAYTAYTTSPTTASSWTATQNVSITATPTGNFGTNQTINSLKVNAASAVTLPQGAAADKLTVDSGGFIFLGAGTKLLGPASPATIANLTAGSTGTSTAYRAGAANSELFFHVTGGDVTVNSTIIDNSSLTGTAIGLVKTQSGKLILAANNSYTGPTTIGGGILQLGNNTLTGSLGSTAAVVNNGTLAFNRSDAALTFINNISGIGGVNQNNAADTLTLSGTNTYYGDTILTAGGIKAGSTTGLSPNSNFALVNVASAILNLNGFNSTIGGLADSGAAGSNSQVQLGANTLTVGGNNIASQTYTGIISGSAGSGLIKTGTGLLTLAGNNTFAGPITLGTLNQNVGGLTQSGASTGLTGATVNGGTLTFSNNAATTIGGAVNINGGSLVMSGTGVNTIGGALTVANAGIANFSGAGSTLNVTGATTLGNAAAVTIANIANFTGAVALNDQSSLTLSSAAAANTFAGGLTVGAAASIALAGTNTFGAVAGGPNGATFSNSGVLALGGPSIFNGPLLINGALAVTTSAGSTSQSSAFRAPVTISAGSLTVGALTITNATTINANPVVTCATTAGLQIGMIVSGSGIPANAAVVQILNGSTFVLSANATAAASGLSLTAAGGIGLTSCATTFGSPTVTCDSTALIGAGMLVTGPNILPGTTVSSVTNGTTFVMNKNATSASVAAVPATAQRVFRTFTGGATTSASANITMTSTAGLTAGMAITGTNIPANTIILAVTSGTAAVMSANASATGSSLTFTAAGTTVIAGCATTSGSPNVTCNSTWPLFVGMTLVGTNVPAGATVASITGPTSFTMSANASATGSGLVFTGGQLSFANCVTTTGTTTVTTTSTTGLSVGMGISGTGIAANTTVASITNSTTFVLSANATASGTVTLTATGGGNVPLAFCATTAGNTTVTCASTAFLGAGMPISGTGIPAGATVSSVTNATTFVLSAAATATSNALNLAVTPAGNAYDGLVTVNGAGTYGSVGNGTYSNGLSVGNTGAISIMSGNNTFGSVPNGAAGATFNQSGTLAMPGLNTFNGPLVVGGNLALTLGSSANTTAFKAPVTVGAGSVTVGNTVTFSNLATTFGSTTARVASTAALVPGMLITGTNIAPGTTVVSVTSATDFVMSKAAIGNTLTLTAGAVTLVGCSTASNTIVTCTSTAGVVVGALVSGPGIVNGTTVASITNSTTLVLSVAATATVAAVTLTGSVGSSFDQLLTVNGGGSVTTNTSNTFSKGLFVDSTGIVTSMTGNNIFGTVPNGTEAVTFNQSGTLSMTGVNTFNGPLNLNGNLGVTLGGALNATTFKAPVTVSAGSVTQGGTTTIATLATPGATTFGSTTVNVASTANAIAGMVITGTGIAPGTTISAVANGVLTLSKPATATSSTSAVTLTVSLPQTHEQLLTVNGGGSFTSNNVGITYNKGIFVDTTGVIALGSGNNVFGLTSSDGVTFKQSGSVLATGVNLFNGPLLIDGTAALTLGSNLNPTTFKAPVIVNNGSLTVGGGTYTVANCLMTSGSNLVTTYTPNGTTNLVVGTSVTGTNIPAGATVTAVNSAGTFTMSGNATATIAPVTLTATGNATLAAVATTAGSTTITYTSSTAVTAGMSISGTNIPGGATVASVTNATTLVLSAPATGTGSGGTATVTGTVVMTSCITTSASTTVTCPASNLATGMTVTGTGIPASTTIATVTNTAPVTTFTLSQAATVTQGGVTLTFQNPTATFDKLVAVTGYGTFSSTGNNTFSEGLTADPSTTLTLAGNNTFGGLTGLTLRSAGALTMAGGNTFSGPLNIQGALALTLSNATATGNSFLSTVRVDSGSLAMAQPNATFGGRVSLNTPNTSTISGAGGTVAFNAGLTLSNGKFTIPGAGAVTMGTSVVSLSNCATTAASTTVTCASTSMLTVGMTVMGTNIPAGAIVNSIISTTSFELSAAATGTGSALTLSATTLSPGMNPVALTNCVTNGTTTVTTTSTAALTPGMAVTGTNIPAGATIGSITNGTTFVLSIAATGSGSGLALTALPASALTVSGIAGLTLGTPVVLLVNSSTTSGSTTVTCNSTTGLAAGMTITGGGANIPVGATVVSLTATSFVLSAAATGTASGMVLTGTGNTAPATIVGNVDISGTGRVAFNGGLNVTGSTTLANQSTLTIGGTSAFNGNVTFSNPFGTTLSATAMTGLVTVNQGNIVVNGAPTGIKGITLNGGNLSISPATGTAIMPISLNAAGSGLLLNNSVSVNSATLVLDSHLQVAAGKVLDLNLTSPSVLAGVVSGAGGVTKTGAANLTLNGGNSFTGALTINGGTVIAAPTAVTPGIKGVIGDITPVVMVGGSTLDLGSNRTEVLGSLSGAGSVLLGLNGGIGFAGSASTTFAGSISNTGSGLLLKRGAGSQTLTGANSFTGSIEIEGGTLVIAAPGSNAFPDTVDLNLSRANSTLMVSTSEALRQVNGQPGSVINLGVGATLSASYTDAAPVVINTVLVTGSRLTAAMSDPGTRFLNAGMVITGTDSLLTPTWVVQIVGTGLNGSQGTLLSSAAAPGDIVNVNFTRVGVLASDLVGQGSFAKNGPGALVLAGSHSTTGDVIINQGSIMLGGIESGGKYVLQNILSDSGRLVFGATGDQTVDVASNATNLQVFERIGGLAGGGSSGSHILNLVSGVSNSEKNVGTLFIGGNNQNTTFEGIIDGGDNQGASVVGRVMVMKEGTGTFTYRNKFSTGFDGTLRLENGNFTVEGSGGLNGGHSQISMGNAAGAVFQSNGVIQTMLYLNGGAGVTAANRNGVPGALVGNYLNQRGGEVRLSTSSSSLVLNGGIGEQWYAGSITGSGSLTKTGLHTLVLAGPNTFTGDFVMGTGQVILGYMSRTTGVGAAAAGVVRGSLGDSTRLQVGPGGIAFNNLDETIGSITTSAELENVTIGRGTLTLSNARDPSQIESDKHESFSGSIANGGGVSNTGRDIPNIGKLQVNGGVLLLTGLKALNGPSLGIGSGATVTLGKPSIGTDVLIDTTRVTLAPSIVLANCNASPAVLTNCVIGAPLQLTNCTTVAPAMLTNCTTIGPVVLTNCSATPITLTSCATTAPIVLTNCSTTFGSTTVTCSSTAALVVGMRVTGTNIPAGATVSSITDGITFELSAAATGDDTALTLSVPSTKVTCNSTAALAVGMRISGNANIPAGATVASITDGITFQLSVPATGGASGLTLSALGFKVTCASTAALAAGMRVSGLNVPAGALVSSITNGTTFQMSVAATAAFSGQTLAANSTTVTCDSTAGIATGRSITGTNIPPGATVSSITNGTTLELSSAATGSGSGLTLTVPNPTVTCDSTAALEVGMLVTGSTIPPGATVALITDGTTFLLSQPATGAGSGLTLSIPSTTITCDSTASLAVGMPLVGSGISAGATVKAIADGTTFVMSAPALSSGATTAGISSFVVLSNCTTTASSATVTCDSTAALATGMLIMGPNVPAGATVSSKLNSTTFTLSSPASGSGSNLTLAVPATMVTCTSTASLKAGMTVTGPDLPVGAIVNWITNSTTFVLNTPATFTGATAVAVAGGTLNFKDSTGITGEVIGSLSGGGIVDISPQPPLIIGNPIVNRTLTLTAAGGLANDEFSGTITGAGGSLILDGRGNLVMSGTNTYTGATQVQNGATLTLNTSALATGTSTIISDSSALRLGQGIVRLLGKQTETVSSTTLDAGQNAIVRDVSSEGGIALGAITRNVGGSFIVPVGVASTITANNGANILGSWAVSIGQTNGDPNTADTYSWARKSNGAGATTIEGLLASDYSSTWAPGNHTALQGSVAGITGATATLRVGDVPLVATDEMTIDIMHTAQLSEGGLMVTPFFGARKLTIEADPDTNNSAPQLVSGNDMFNIHQFDKEGTLIINLPLKDNGSPASFTKTGGGKMVLLGANTFSGPVTIGDGTVQLGDGITSVAGRFLLGLSTLPIINHGVLAVDVGVGGIYTITNSINGTGAIRLVSGTSLELGAASGYSGHTTVVSGTIQAFNAGALGSADVGTSVDSGATLFIDAVGTSNEPVSLMGGSLNTRQSAVLGAPVTVLGDSSINAVAGTTTLKSVLSPFGSLVTFNASSSGSVGKIVINNPAGYANSRIDSGELIFQGGGIL